MQAIIFCAGLGTRFKPWTDQHPKALAVVNGKSLLQRNVEYLQQFGITDVIVNVHHFADQIVQAVKDNNGWGSNIIISDETSAVLETGGGLLHAKHLFKENEPFVSLNVDVLTDFDLNKLIAFQQQQQSLIAFTTSDRKTSRNLLFDENDRLCGWQNNQTGEQRISIAQEGLQPKAYDCVVLYQYEVLNLIGLEGKFSLIDLYLDLAKHHTIAGLDHSGDKWVDVGRPESVAVAEALFQ